MKTANNRADRNNPEKSRFFYGYVIAIASFFIIMLTFGLYMIFGIFFKPLQDQFGWSSAMTSGPFSLSMMVSGFASVVMGRLNDRFGPRVVVTISGLLIGLAYLLMSQVTEIWHLYLYLGIIMGIGIGGTWVPVMSTVARWFIKRRSQISGVVIIGGGTSGLIAPLIVSRLIVSCGWQTSYVVLGIVVLVVVTIAAQFLRRDPAQMGLVPDGGATAGIPEMRAENRDFSFKEAVATSQFWVLFLMFICFGICLFGIQVHIVPHAIDLGITPILAANLLSVNLGVSILGNYFVGTLGDRIGNRLVFLLGFIVFAVALLSLFFAGELWMLYVFSMVFGFTHGGLATSESPIVAWLFGLKSHGLIYGVVGMGFTIGASLGPLVMGFVFDLTGGYKIAFLICTFVAVLGLIFAIALRPTRLAGGKP
jgi:MFS family permease